MTDYTPASDSTGMRRRVAAVDLLRGFLMIVMALDHSRDFFSSAQIDPTNPLQSWPSLFFTRWITHLCAPGFVALAGTSVYLQRRFGRSAGSMAGRLVTRGVWLIGVEFALVSFGLLFSYQFFYIQVIYAIGGSMILLALLQRLPTIVATIYGVIVLGLHNTLDKIPPSHFGSAANAYKLLMRPGIILHNHHPFALIAFPLIPWSGVMALGYAFGAIVILPAERRRTWSAALGTALLALFTILRFTNAYGDRIPFKQLTTLSQSAMSFLQLTKYPPSLLFLLATLGVLLLLFALADYAQTHRWLPKLAGIIAVYGRVPFFYYVIHFYVIHAAMLITLMLTSHSTHVLNWSPVGSSPPEDWGYSLPVVYLIWVAVVCAMYYPCKWFADVKARRHDWWLSYL